MGNFVSTRLATDAQVKQFLGVCEGVSGELRTGTGGLSNTGAPPVRVGLPRAGGPPQGRSPPGWVELIHPLRVWIEQKVEEGGVCPSAPAPALSWCHPLPCPRVLRPLDVG